LAWVEVLFVDLYFGKGVLFEEHPLEEQVENLDGVLVLKNPQIL
jgi:hypothetical protein